MIEIKKKYIETINYSSFSKKYNECNNLEQLSLKVPLIIEQSIIDSFDLSNVYFYSEVIIRNCIIKDLKILHSLFFKSLHFASNVVLNDVDYQCRGNNKALFIVEKNVFYDFLNISYCNFDDVVYFTDNYLFKGSNILGNQKKRYVNLFNLGVIAEGNIGKIDLDNEDVDRIWPYV